MIIDDALARGEFLIRVQPALSARGMSLVGDESHLDPSLCLVAGVSTGRVSRGPVRARVRVFRVDETRVIEGVEVANVRRPHRVVGRHGTRERVRGRGGTARRGDVHFLGGESRDDGIIQVVIKTTVPTCSPCERRF